MQSISSAFALALIEAMGSADTPINPLAVTLTKTTAPLTPERIPLHELSRLIEDVQVRSGNEDLGLLAYEKAHPAHLGALGYAAMSSATLREAMARMVEHHTMIGTGFCMFMDSTASTLRMAGLSATPQNALPRVFVDAVASITLGLLHWLAPSLRITPVRAEFMYEQPRNTGRLEQLFGTDLRFSCPVNALTFQRADAEHAVATFDPSLQHIHDQYLKRCQDEQNSDSITARTTGAILQHLNQARALGMEDIAKTLGLSNHQLIRSLDKDGQRFQKLVDTVKKQHSHHLLMNTSLSLKQISYSVGFKNPSAFNKACERWFGMSSGTYRLGRRA
ncbi:AraC family transcriptional regulator [Pseudomonas abietaniphila]|uniref:Helix-turn-helix domain-containing protein n=1 Tax=Pseudomonas abietaniphila TaxID=89065 RepID=A0A1G8GRT4_9PSED|nr:AraC family transcriptional regulator [Pseudomonas abietaniphila]SDH97057.1 Helix-turn-helix domain-containing protein [Pseudomonas abietaniphila]